ncbi:methyltransferase type 11 [Bacillus cereus]|nr:methyltransferase type 11 [Bacillus cereus]
MAFSNGINAPKGNYGKGRKMISVMDILADEPIIYRNIRNSVEVDDKTESKNKVENGDLVFVRSSEIRNEVGWAKAYLQEEYALYSGFSIRGKKKSDFDAEFIELSLNSSNRGQIERQAGGSTRFNVSQSILKSIEILEPSIEEQMKIGDFFKKLNETIALHQKELTTLKQTKQGLLQKMFPQKGKSVPEVRFPGFTGEWEECELGAIIENMYNGQTPSRFNDENWNGEINWLSSGELNRGVVTTTIEKITPAGQKDANLRIVPKGTFVMAITGLEAAGTRGNCAMLSIDTTLNQSCMAIFPKESVLDSVFLFQWYRKVGEEYGIRYTQGTKQQSYNAELIKLLPIIVPKIDEQIKIGNFFKKLDDTIALHQRELDALKETKKAFLQKMFA